MSNEKLRIFINTPCIRVRARVYVYVRVYVQAIIAGIEANRTSSRILGRNFRRMEEGPRSHHSFFINHLHATPLPSEFRPVSWTFDNQIK